MQSISVTMGYAGARPPPYTTQIQAPRNWRWGRRRAPPQQEVYLGHVEGTKGLRGSSGLIIGVTQRWVGELPDPQESLSKQRGIHYPRTNTSRRQRPLPPDLGGCSTGTPRLGPPGIHQPSSCYVPLSTLSQGGVLFSLGHRLWTRA